MNEKHRPDNATSTVLNGFAARIRAMESVLLALIATHPEREAVKTVFHGLASVEGNLMLDAAFAEAIPPEFAQLQVQQIEKVLQEWRAVFEKQPDSKK